MNQDRYVDIQEAFRIMWDRFPHPVLLLAKDRTIVDVNQPARDLGVPVGIRCRDISPYPDKCRNQCQANKALAEGKARIITSRQDGSASTTYWIPLDSSRQDRELFLHFVVPIAHEDLPETADREQ